MNLILLQTSEEASFLPAHDPRVDHVRRVLRLGEGESFYVGLIHGPRGLARIVKADDAGLTLETSWEALSPAPHPLTALIAVPRPHTAGRMLQEGAALGLERMIFFPPAKGERSYADARLWQDQGWREPVEKGLAQAFMTQGPDVQVVSSLREGLKLCDSPGMALDIYEAETSVAHAPLGKGPWAFALGPERGWDENERALLRAKNWRLVHLGGRVLRSETALSAAAAVLLARTGSLDSPYQPPRIPEIQR